MDFTTQVLWDFTSRHVLVIMKLETREIVHMGITASPTLAWVKQQVREATPWTSARDLSCTTTTASSGSTDSLKQASAARWTRGFPA